MWHAGTLRWVHFERVHHTLRRSYGWLVDGWLWTTPQKSARENVPFVHDVSTFSPLFIPLVLLLTTILDCAVFLRVLAPAWKRSMIKFHLNLNFESVVACTLLRTVVCLVGVALRELRFSAFHVFHFLFGEN